MRWCGMRLLYKVNVVTCQGPGGGRMGFSTRELSRWRLLFLYIYFNVRHSTPQAASARESIRGLGDLAGSNLYVVIQ